MKGQALLSIQNVSQAFEIPGSSQELLPVLDDVSFSVEECEIICVVGPSGCGKTTLLRILAGLDAPKSGEVTTSLGSIDSPSPERIMIFQDLYLFDWMTAEANITFALEAKGIGRHAWADRASDLLKLVGLSSFAKYYPAELSGGMRQRLAFARALAAEPRVLLMDEPFASLDVETRAALEGDFLILHDVKRFTAILVTHDLRQALLLGDRILVLSHRPATIKLSIPVPFPRPRDPHIRFHREFREIEGLLEDNLRSGEIAI